MNARHYEASDDTRGILGRERMRANVVVGAWLLRARIPVIMEGESPSSKKLKTERPQFRPEDHGLEKDFRLTSFTKLKG
jgi:hypothetical protein